MTIRVANPARDQRQQSASAGIKEGTLPRCRRDVVERVAAETPCVHSRTESRHRRLFRLTVFVVGAFAVWSPGSSAQVDSASATCDSEDRPIYFDADGLIVHANLDGGDTAQREGWYWLGIWIRDRLLGNPWPVPRSLTFSQAMDLLEPGHDGIFHRHPKLAPWNDPFSDEYGFSRDQMIPIVAALGAWGRHDAIYRLWNALPQDAAGKHAFNGHWLNALGKRSGDCPDVRNRDCWTTGPGGIRYDDPFCEAQKTADLATCESKVAFTGDLVGPTTQNLFSRALKEPSLWAGDPGEEELAANVALRLSAAARDRDDVGDDLNLIVMLLVALSESPSPVSGTAAATYEATRPLSYGSFLGTYCRLYGDDADDMVPRLIAGIQGPTAPWTPDTSGIYGAIRWYHRPWTGANPLLAVLYEPIIATYFRARPKVPPGEFGVPTRRR